jgi:hypothetical protein
LLVDERLVPTRDIFLCQAVVIIIFVVAERIGVANSMVVGLGILAIATAGSAYLGHRLLDRRGGALNAYSVALAIGTAIFWLKWWALD